MLPNKTKKRALERSCRNLICLALAATAWPASAASLNWDPFFSGTATGGGTGFWDLSAFNWYNGTLVQWNNVTPDSAVFGGTAGTVSLQTNINAAGLTFNTNNYALDLQGFNLTETGTILGSANLGTISIGNSNPTTPSTFSVAAIPSSGPKLTGNLNVTLTGGGTWTPTPANDFTGTLWLQGSTTVTSNANNRLGSATGQIKLDGTTSLVLLSTTNPQAETYTRNIELVGTGAKIGTTGVRNITLSGQITGSGAFTQSQTQGMLTLTGNNSYTGATSVTSGGPALVAGSDTAFGNTTGITLVAASMLGFKGDADGSISVGAIPLALNGPIPALNGIAMVHNFDGNNFFAGAITGITTPRNVGAEASSSLTFTGNMSFQRGLTKLGLGTIVLAGSNTYGTGNVSNNDNATIIDQGTLRLDFSLANLADAAPSTSQTDIINHGNASITGNQSSELILAGGTLEVRGKATQANGQRFKDRIAASATAAGLGFRINTGASAVKVDANGAAGVLVSLGRISLRQAGGTVDFTLPTGTQTTTNGITVGTNPNVNGILGGFATVGATDWATTGASGATTPITALATYSSDTWAAGANTTVTTSSTVPAASTTNSLRFHATDANTLTLSGVNTITSGGLLVTNNVGANTSVITGGLLAGTVNNGTATYVTGNYSSDLIVHQHNPAAPLRIESIIADPAAPADKQGSTASSTTITLTGGSNTRDLYVGMPISGTNIPAGAVVSDIRTDTIFTISANATTTGAGATFTFGSTSGLTKTGAGELELAGANTYTGATSVTGGILKLSNAAALGSGNLALDTGVIGLTTASGDFTRPLGTGAGAVQFLSGGGFAAYGGTRLVNLGGASAAVTWAENTTAFVRGGSIFILGATDADGTVEFQNPIKLNPSNPAVPLNRTVEVRDGFAAIDARLSGVLSTEAGFIKIGGGTLELSVPELYTGPTIVQEGTLLLTGSLAASSLVSVTAGGTLRGGGSLGQLTLSGGVIAPGVDVGTLSTGSLLLNGGSFSFKLGADGSDLLNVTGSISLNAPIALTIGLGLALPQNVPLVIVSNDGADPVSFAGAGARLTYNGVALNEGDHFVAVDGPNSQEFVLTYAGGPGTNDIAVTPVPEPGSWAVAAIGAAMVVGLRFRRRRGV